MFSSESFLTHTFKTPSSSSFLSRLLADHRDRSKNSVASWVVVKNLILAKPSRSQRSRSVSRIEPSLGLATFLELLLIFTSFIRTDLFIQACLAPTGLRNPETSKPPALCSETSLRQL